MPIPWGSIEGWERGKRGEKYHTKCLVAVDHPHELFSIDSRGVLSRLKAEASDSSVENKSNARRSVKDLLSRTSAESAHGQGGLQF